MSMRKWMLWAALVAVGCNGKLSVSEGDGGAGAGTGGARTAGAAGKSYGGDRPDNKGGSGGRDFGTAGTHDPYSSAGTRAEAGTGTSGAFNTPGPGDIEQDCIPGGLILEADGSPAKTLIQTLTRCNEGLACDAQNKCVPAPDCPSSGLCVMRRAALAGSGGVGGAPGSMLPPLGSGNGGAPPLGVGGVPAGGADNNNGPLTYATEKNGVVALTANESRVYWVEYGTRDPLGNYQHDGALLAYTIADGTTTVLASGLEGPTGVQLTTSHAYIYVDGAPLLGALTAPQLLRVPLAGGTPQLVQDGAQPWSFAASGSQAFWNSGGNTIYAMLSDENATPTVFVSAAARGLTTDATDLYYGTPDEQLMRSPFNGASPVGLNLYAGNFMLYEDGIFGIERLVVEGGAGLLSRAPKSGGPFLRVRALGAGYPGRLQVMADHYFVDVQAFSSNAWTDKRQVLTADFAANDPPIRVLERRNRNNLVDQLWVGTANALYWSEGQAIYQQPLPTP